MKVLIKGAGDLATGVACRLHVCGMQLIMTDLPVPTTVRRTVSYSRAICEGQASVEGITAVCAKTADEAIRLAGSGQIAVIADPDAHIRTVWKPDVVVDAILAKKNLGTSMTDAPVVIGLGPGFTAGADCHCVIETVRGHDLGRCIYSGCALPDTGIPGEVNGYTAERVLRAPSDGIFRPLVSIGDPVSAGTVCGEVDGTPIRAAITGMVRGLLQDGVPVAAGMKCGDVDPRNIRSYCGTVSDKARSVAGGVLEAILTLDPLHRFRE